MNTLVNVVAVGLLCASLSACHDSENTSKALDDKDKSAKISQTLNAPDELKPEINQTDDVGVKFYGVEQNLQRFSSLDIVNDSNVKQLSPAWVLSLGNNRGQQSQPLIINGMMYLTTNNATFAINAKTGRQLWKSTVEYPADTVTCCGITNRGLTWFDGVLYRATLDNHIIAINPDTGEKIWDKKAADLKGGFSMTSAPLVANNTLITGIAGGEFGVRAFLDGWDPKTGEHLWRFYTVPKPGEPGSETWKGDDWKTGGGPTWLIGSYDKELDLVYWGVGNPAPFNANMHEGDNLYTNSMLAIRPKTGELVWHYQFTPNDSFDYDAVNDPILIDIPLDGIPRKLLIQANRNGYFYVIDRTNGELLQANAFVDKINWADGIDMETGRPIRSERFKNMLTNKERTEIWPSAFGGKNLAPMSYSPITGLAYANTFNVGWHYTPVQQEYKKGIFYIGAKMEWIMDEEYKGYLKAIDPLTGKSAWEYPTKIPMNGGTLATAGNLVFSGAQTGELYAFNAKTGEKLWEYRTSSGIIAPPVTYKIDGEQYVAVTSGLGGAYINLSGDPQLKNINPGGSMWVFKLSNALDASTPSAEVYLAPEVTKKQDSLFSETAETTEWSANAKKGLELYEQTCAHCHGVNMVTSGTTYDLRSFPKTDKKRFIESVRDGKGTMPAWGAKLSAEDINAIYEYVVH